MACSVYAAQYLLEGLFTHDAGNQALALMTADNDRSWKHMLESGTTITWEAWDQRYKPNQDWNHAWGAAPANLLPRFVLGVQAASPGWKLASIRPNPGPLKFAEGKVPTPLGPVLVRWKNQSSFELSIKLPDGMSAKVELPAAAGSKGVLIDGKPAAAQRKNSRWVLQDNISGTATLTVK
jgi:alpha-L-rhamnosidase